MGLFLFLLGLTVTLTAIIRYHLRKMKAYDLILLRRELGRLLAVEQIDRELFQELTFKIDEMLRELLGVGGATEFWENRRNAAWTMLRERMKIPFLTPPWKSEVKFKIPKKRLVPKRKTGKPYPTEPPPLPETTKQAPAPSFTYTAKSADTKIPKVPADVEPGIAEQPESVEPVAPAPSFTYTAEPAKVETDDKTVKPIEKQETEIPETPVEPEAEAEISEQPESAEPVEQIPSFTYTSEPVEAGTDDKTVRPAEKQETEISETPEVPALPKIPEPSKTPLAVEKRARTESDSFAWKPEEPGPLERALRQFSDLSKLAAPFMVRNIGWFVGGFLLVTGTIFLVAVTRDFTQAFIISAALLTYTLLFMYGAYQFRRRRPDLNDAFIVLVAIGTLLMPLSVSATTGLLDIAVSSPFRMAGAFLMAALNIAAFYLAVRFGAGAADSSLRGTYPKLFIALCSVQLAAPLTSGASSWHLLAGFHLVILGLFGYAMIRFVNDWMKSIFVDARKITSYAAGALVFAGTVSFVHLTWRYPDSLPDGYYGPFLMALCGILFYADSRFKQWTSDYPFLSKFTFAVYALSITALIIPFNAPSARYVTLVLGAGVYAAMVRYYLSLPPLYLLIACASWLYYLLFLKDIPHDAWFLAGIPGLAALLFLHRFAVGRKANGLALLLFRAMTILAFGLAGWSFIHSVPGWTATITGVAATGFLYYLLGFIPACLASGEGWTSATEPIPPDIVNLRNSPWIYTVAAFATITTAYFPLTVPGKWTAQFAIATGISAVLYICGGMYLRHRDKKEYKAVEEASLNMALACAVLALPLVVFSGPLDYTKNVPMPFVMFLSAGVMLWLSLALRVRPLFYAAAIIGGAAGTIVKYTYFPRVSVGTMKILSVLSIWVMLWYMDRKQPASGDETPQPGSQGSRLFGIFPTGTRTVIGTVRTPLKQIMVVLWAWALFRLVRYILFNPLKPAWVLNAGLETAATMILLAYFRQLRFWPAAVLLGLSATLAFVWKLGFQEPIDLAFAGALYAFFIQNATTWLADQPFALRLAKSLRLGSGQGEGAKQIALYTHWTAYAIVVAAVGAALTQWIRRPELSVLLPFFTGMAFMLIAGQQLRTRIHSWVVILIAVFASLAMHTGFIGLSETAKLSVDPRTGLLFAIVGLGMWLTARIIEFRSADLQFEFDDSMYRKPLRLTCAGLAIASAFQATALVWGDMAEFFGMAPTVAISLAGLAIFLANGKFRSMWMCLLGILCASLGLLWIQALALNSSGPFTQVFWSVPADQWISLSLLGFAMAFTSRIANLESFYKKPFWTAAILYWIWTFVESGPVLARSFATGSMPAHGPLLLLIQCAAVFPLAGPLKEASRLRGFGTGLLLSAAIVGLFAGQPDVYGNVAVCWGFVMWTVANCLLPRFNEKWPQWSVDPVSWPWFGFAFVIVGVPFLPDRLGNWSWWIAFSIYSFLLLRNSSRNGFAWLGAGSLVAAGFILIWNILNVYYPFQFLIIAGLIWLNLLACIVHVWRRFGKTVSERLGWKNADLAAPFNVLPFIVMSFCLFGYIFYYLLAIFLFDDVKNIDFAVSAITVLSFFHMFRIRSTAGATHFLFLSLFALSLGIWTKAPVPLLHLPLLAMLWCVGMHAAGILANRKTPDWKGFPEIRQAIEHWIAAVPWAGLAMLVFTLFTTINKYSMDEKDALLYWPHWMAATVFLLAFSRSIPGNIWQWAAGFTITAGGLIVISEFIDKVSDTMWITLTLVWANALMRLAHLWKRRGEAWSKVLGWKNADFEGPFLFWPFLVAATWIFLSLKGGMLWVVYHMHTSLMPELFICFVLVGSFFHLFSLRQNIITAHFLILSIFTTALIGWLSILDSLSHAPLSLAIWSCVLLGFQVYAGRKKEKLGDIFSATGHWLLVVPWIGLAALVVVKVATLQETLATLAIFAGIVAGVGRIRKSGGLLFAGRILGLILLHTWPLLFLPANQAAGMPLWKIIPQLQAQFERLQTLFPWWSLQLALLVWFLPALYGKFGKYIGIETDGKKTFNFRLEVGLALSEWALHFYVFLSRVMSGRIELIDKINSAAALAAAGLLAALAVKTIRETRNTALVYALAVFAFLNCVYVRFLIFGAVPVTALDTAAIMGVACGVYLLQRFIHADYLAEPWYRIIVALTFLALFTVVPFEMAPTRSSAFLVAAGAIFLSLRSTTGKPVPLYLGVLAINAAFYTWIPLWAERSDLIQLYVAPASLTVLALLHMHRGELKRSTLNGARLAAICSLYACATIDFFLGPEFARFALAVVLSLVGIGLGVVLRVRAFLYGGVIFMVMNVIGQLIRFYPKESVGQGIMLVTLGVLVIGGMMWFRLKREEVLKRIRIFRADLEEWD